MSDLVFLKDFEPRSIGFISSAFICHRFSSRSQCPPIDIPSYESPQPTFEGSVYMILEIGGYCKLFGTVIMLSLYYFKSRSTSIYSVTLHSKLLFDFFSARVLHLSDALQHRGPNLFSGIVAVTIPIRLASSLIFKNSFSRQKLMNSAFSLSSHLLHSATCLMNPRKVSFCDGKKVLLPGCVKIFKRRSIFFYCLKKTHLVALQTSKT